MKKVTAIVLLTLLLALWAQPACGAGSAYMSVSAANSTAHRGDTVDFIVSLSTVEDCRSGGIILSYNTAVFEFVSGSCTVAGAALSSFSGGTGSFALSSGATLSGRIFSFKLRVKADAPFGTYNITGNANVRDSSGALSTGVNAAQVTVACQHQYSAWSKANDNSHTRACSVCGEKPIEPHNWDSVTIDQYANCQQTGQRTLKCTACGAARTETMPIASYHSYESWEKVDEKQHTASCSVCGKKAAVDHTWDEGQVTREPDCIHTGERFHTCTAAGCGVTTTQTIPETGVHTYDNECDTGCNVCGLARTITHKYEETWTTAKDSHYKKCVYCGDQQEKAAHIPGPEPTADDPQLCAVCGYIIKPSLNHEHTPGEAWITSGTAHWKSCPGCSEQLEHREHDFENPCDTACETCGLTRETAHTYSEKWSSDESQHFYLCTGCGIQKDSAAHTPGEPATEFMPQLCAVCGYELAPALGHRFAAFWSYDQFQHYHGCDCGYHTDAQDHTWDAGAEKDNILTFTCTVCGARRSQLPPADWRLVLLLAVPFLLGGGLGATLTLLVKRRRR